MSMFDSDMPSDMDSGMEPDPFAAAMRAARQQHEEAEMESNTREEPKPSHQQDGLKKLNKMIGLKSVKKQIDYYLANATFQRRARKIGQTASNDSMNIVFEGNPGTGKTQVARLMGSILYQNHVTQSPKFVEIDSSNILSNMVGRDTKNLRHYIRKAMGGTLFIDEAYMLTPTGGINGESESKREVLGELTRQSENQNGKLAIILAGYTNKMEEFLDINPGLRSRFDHKIYFPDYTIDELTDIFKLHANEAHVKYDAYDIRLVHDYLAQFIPFAKKNKNDGNGRTVREILKFIMDSRNYRNRGNMLHVTSKKINTIKPEDITRGFNLMKSNTKIRYQDNEDSPLEQEIQKLKKGMIEATRLDHKSNPQKQKDNKQTPAKEPSKN